MRKEHMEMQPTTQQDDRYQTTVNVRTFGAVGDGIHDDTHAFQEALDAIRECEGAVYVPAGTYLCGQINMYQGCAIFGQSAWNVETPAGARLLFRGAPQDTCLIDAGDCYGAVIHGLCLEGRHLGNDIIGIRWHNKRSRVEDTMHLESCRISDFSGDGLSIESMWCDSIRHCLFTRNDGWGVWLNGADIFITDDTFSYNGKGGLMGQSFNAATMTGNRFEYNDGPGMEYRSGHVVHFMGNSYIGNRGPGLVVTHRGQVGNCNALIGNLFCDNATDIAELGKDNCHVHFNSQLNCTFLSNTFLGGTQNPAYAITHEYTWAHVCTNNTMDGAMTQSAFLDMGGHNGYDCYENNLGAPAAAQDGWKHW